MCYIVRSNRVCDHPFFPLHVTEIQFLTPQAKFTASFASSFVPRLNWLSHQGVGKVAKWAAKGAAKPHVADVTQCDPFYGTCTGWTSVTPSEIFFIYFDIRLLVGCFVISCPSFDSACCTTLPGFIRLGRICAFNAIFITWVFSWPDRFCHESKELNVSLETDSFERYEKQQE